MSRSSNRAEGSNRVVVWSALATIAIALPTLIAYNVPPSATFFNQAAALIGWGLFLTACAVTLDARAWPRSKEALSLLLALVFVAPHARGASARRIRAGQLRFSTFGKRGGLPAIASCRRGNNIQDMQLATATVIAGKLTVEGLEIPDGETVVILARETEEDIVLSPEEEAELAESVAEADRGETITVEELFARLDRLR